LTFDFLLTLMINPQELLFTVDENNQPIKPVERHIAHKEKIWHRTAHIWVVNSQKQILCQKRSMKKDSFPGFWEAFFGGHLAPGEEYIDNAIQETKEELGITVKSEDLHFFTIFKDINGYEFQAQYWLKWDGDSSSITYEADEIDEIKWFGIDELVELLVKQTNNNWTHIGSEKAILDYLNQKEI
jgi:isopentenyldiphosphate isomerase